MAKVRVTKEFKFEMGHALWNYEGACRNLHGHSYRLFVTVIGDVRNELNHPEDGMVIDFTRLSSIVNKEIVDKYDHALLLNKAGNYPNLLDSEQLFERFEWTDFQPTCENLVAYFADKIAVKLPSDIKLFSLKLYETARSYAEWIASDN